MALLVVEAAVEEQLGHAEHPVHRRPDLVAHGGEEVALGLAGSLCGLLRAQELLGACGDLVLEVVAMACQACIALGDLAEHAVEATGEGIELDDTAGFGARAVVLGVGDALHQRGQGRQWLQHRAVEPAQRVGGEQQRDRRGEHRNRAVGEHLEVERTQIEVEVEHPDHVPALDDRLGQVQCLEAEVRVLGRKVHRLPALFDELAVTRKRGSGYIEDRCAAYVRQALQGREHARGGVVVEEHQAGGGIVGKHPRHHPSIALERERADQEATEGDRHREHRHRGAERALAYAAQLFAEGDAVVVFVVGHLHRLISVARLRSFELSPSPWRRAAARLTEKRI